ncbi:MAG: DUF4830 domain-containing protein [Ruminococcaceae bacterium]|nr:DUF4830 domain-containing protein [Oscillospiraceae bacterium]
MYYVHVKFPKRRAGLLMCLVALVLVTTAILSGCWGKSDPGTAVPGSTNEERLAYLTGLGWEVKPEPVETLELQLPENLKGEYGDYLKLQQENGLPFQQYGGKQVTRYTYTVCNHPAAEKGAQVNLYLHEGQIIGGDVILTGENGFQAGLQFPKQS